MTERDLPKAGDVYSFDRYPFVRTSRTIMDSDGPFEVACWRPGTDNRAVQPDDFEAYANALGSIVLNVVGVYTPPGFPMRVFCTRQWKDPDGNVFGNNKLHIWTLQKFRRISSRFGYEFELDPEHRYDRVFGNEATASRALEGEG